MRTDLVDPGDSWNTAKTFLVWPFDPFIGISYSYLIPQGLSFTLTGEYSPDETAFCIALINGCPLALVKPSPFSYASDWERWVRSWKSELFY